MAVGRRVVERVCAVTLTCLVVSAVAAGGAPARRAPGGGRFGMHSMLYLDSPSEFKRAMFAEAAEIGAKSIRVNVEVSGIVRDGGWSRDWRGLDEYIALAARFGLQVDAVLHATPSWIADCPAGIGFMDSYRCPVSDLPTWGEYIGEIVTHAHGAIRSWEVSNEPDLGWEYLGSPERYARELTTAHDAVKRADPHARVLIGAAASPAGWPWFARVMAALGPHPGESFDIANIHARGRAAKVGSHVRFWRAFYRSAGFGGPIWVTEHGYPSDASHQSDPAFSGGTSAQAAYLAQSIPALLRAGAERVYVTQRDNLDGDYASEGLLGGRVSDPAPTSTEMVHKPSYQVIARIIQGDRYPLGPQVAARQGSQSRGR